MDLPPVIPILRFHDLAVTRRFYADWLGFAVDWEEGEPGGPGFLQVSRGPAVLYLSSHHDDGTPGSALVLRWADVRALHAEIAVKDYPFFNPAVEPRGAGVEMQVIDPASNRLRFFEAPR